MGDSSDDVHDARSNTFTISANHETVAAPEKRPSFSQPESMMKQPPCLDNPTDPSPEYRMYVSNSLRAWLWQQQKRKEDKKKSVWREGNGSMDRRRMERERGEIWVHCCHSQPLGSLYIYFNPFRACKSTRNNEWSSNIGSACIEWVTMVNNDDGCWATSGLIMRHTRYTFIEKPKEQVKLSGWIFRAR